MGVFCTGAPFMSHGSLDWQPLRLRGLKEAEGPYGLVGEKLLFDCSQTAELSQVEVLRRECGQHTAHIHSHSEISRPSLTLLFLSGSLPTC